ncbi:NAD(P)-binding protein [Microthyrium microscopicum]|uniref:NAD(P)-binding protein n=1 Tax=Microthyrium microscopicum TaxID=703497 RepID=A0A6A6TWC5_9PEZI|nr:NAD(P)-binding protein [Microthyrium microscopicum]
MAPPTLQNPSIPLNSIILVTAANSLIGSHACDQILAAGYRVRGTVRNASKNAWLTPLFNTRHGAGRFELFEVPDMAAPYAWDDCIVDVSGIAHIAGPVEIFIPDLDAALADYAPLHIALFEAAKRTPSVKSIAMTSSAWAAYTPKADTRFVLTEKTWNDEAVRIARDETLKPGEKGWAPFMALKTEMERACWEWVDKEKPAFAFNTLLIDTVLGSCLDPKNQGIPSTAGFLKDLFYGQGVEIMSQMEPQWHIDTLDAGKLYLAALVTPGVNGERLFGFAERYSWPQVIGMFKELHPDREFPQMVDKGKDIAEVPNQRAEELVKGVGKSGWVGLKDSVKANVESFLC